jgi:hypothetical protein
MAQPYLTPRLVTNVSNGLQQPMNMITQRGNNFYRSNSETAITEPLNLPPEIRLMAGQVFAWIDEFDRIEQFKIDRERTK